MKLDLEKAFDKLNNIVNQLENDKNSLDETIKLFKEGLELSKLCENKLKKAESLVSKLIDQD